LLTGELVATTTLAADTICPPSVVTVTAPSRSSIDITGEWHRAARPAR
jgi:hypothetical protein